MIRVEDGELEFRGSCKAVSEELAYVIAEWWLSCLELMSEEATMHLFDIVLKTSFERIDKGEKDDQS